MKAPNKHPTWVMLGLAVGSREGKREAEEGPPHPGQRELKMAKALTPSKFGAGTRYQVLQHEFSFLTKEIQAPMEICLVVWVFLKCFSGVQHCGRLFRSSNPPPSPIMTQRAFPLPSCLFSQIGTGLPLRYLPFCKFGCIQPRVLIVRV